MPTITFRVVVVFANYGHTSCFWCYSLGLVFIISISYYKNSYFIQFNSLTMTGNNIFILEKVNKKTGLLNMSPNFISYQYSTLFTLHIWVITMKPKYIQDHWWKGLWVNLIKYYSFYIFLITKEITMTLLLKNLCKSHLLLLSEISRYLEKHPKSCYKRKLL